MKPLFLILIGRWFEMILSNEKREEYRDITPYWVRRLIDVDRSLDESKGESNVVPDNICYDILVNGFEFNEVLKSYRAKIKPFEWVYFRHGYNSKNGQCLRGIQSITVGEGLQKWGAEPGKKYFVIKLGEKI